ncbi:hypothetical protein ONZ45_g12059 [Pleurotus djamor]|nr:hypothetical protein ONZ45_g12059 [Pleurotus djamor]
MATVPADRTIFFPPFPPVPSGVQIISFKDFHECGIQVEGDGDVELDGRGIPTVELETPRKGDEPKSNARKKRLFNVEAENQRRAAVSESASKKVTKFGKPSIKEWWHEWHDGESGRRSVVDRQAQTSLMPFDRVIQAANDFAKNRKWPSSLSNVRESWEKYRYYLGILENVPARGKKTNLEDFDDEAGSDDDDNFGNDVFEEAPTSSSKQSKGKQRCSPFVETQTHDDASTSVKLTPEDKLAAFLADPERNARVFLSSYMKYRGLMW